MRFLSCALLALAPAAGHAGPFERPIPQAQSATAEFWFALAALGMVVTLAAVARLVARR